MEAGSFLLNNPPNPDMESFQVAINSPVTEMYGEELIKRDSFKMVEKSGVPNKRTEPLKGVLRSCSPFIDDKLLRRECSIPPLCDSCGLWNI